VVSTAKESIAVDLRETVSGIFANVVAGIILDEDVALSQSEQTHEEVKAKEVKKQRLSKAERQ